MSAQTRFSEAGRLQTEAYPEEQPLLSEAQRRQLLVEWNATQAAFPQDRCFHQLFEEQVERIPDAVAVVFEDHQVTYRELNGRANQVAHYLQRSGVGPEVLVGVCMERSLEMVIALLGILKAGGAYVPLDPSYPAERLAFMMEDARTPVLLTQQRVEKALPAHSAKRISLDADWDALAGESEANPTSSVQPAHLVYVIYTSGSTGKPKGVMITHRGLINYLSWCTQAYRVTEGEGTLVHSPLGFDLTVTSLLSPLVVGQKAILLPEDQGIEALTTALRGGSDFTLVKITPAHLKLLSQELSPEEAAGRTRVFVIGGEALGGEDISFWQRYAPDTRLINEYGPTETVVGCCVYEVPAQTPLSGAIPIGRPIANTELYVLDASLQPLPINVPGELYIGGAGVARGYLNRSELTAERFIAHPFSNEVGARLYRTGDVARYRSDGTLEFLGRLDHQVKVRGFRIEPGEIEAVLELHPAVREAVVVAREEVAGDKRLVAYVVPYEHQAVPVGELKGHLMTQLPAYMVPSAFVELEALPLTSNGKLDRGALPKPEPVKREAEGPYAPPALMAHHQLIQIWEELLDVRPIGIRDNFFYLGGHSLLAARLIERIEQAFGEKLTLATLFAGPTVEQIAQALHSGDEPASTTALVAVQAGGSRRPFFYLHGAWESDAFYCFHLAQHLGPDQPFYALAPYAFGDQRAPDTIEEMAAAHIEVLRSVQPQGPYLLGGFCNGGLVAHEMARQLQAQGEAVDRLVLVEPAYPPAAHALASGLIGWLGAVLGLSREQQCACFLRLRHIYKYLRRQRRADTLKAFRRIDPSIHTLFPTAEALRQDDYALYDWIVTQYVPGPYSGEISLIRAAEERFGGRWRKAARAHNVELHVIPGSHLNCRTDHVGAFAEVLRRCLPREGETTLIEGKPAW